MARQCMATTAGNLKLYAQLHHSYQTPCFDLIVLPKQRNKQKHTTKTKQKKRITKQHKLLNVKANLVLRPPTWSRLPVTQPHLHRSVSSVVFWLKRHARAAGLCSSSSAGVWLIQASL